jgi:hypothetical protein
MNLGEGERRGLKVCTLPTLQNFLETYKYKSHETLRQRIAVIQSLFSFAAKTRYIDRMKHKSKLKKGARDQLSSEEQEEFESVLRNKPIQGCYLLSREEWKQIESDFGRHESRYIRQILPSLERRTYWSSSSENTYNALIFDGSNGYVDYGSRYFDKSVRCACAAAW